MKSRIIQKKKKNAFYVNSETSTAIQSERSEPGKQLDNLSSKNMIKWLNTLAQLPDLFRCIQHGELFFKNSLGIYKK